MYTFDLRQTIISFSLLGISNTFKEMRKGEILEILFDEPAAPSDLLRVLPAASFRVICQERIEGGDTGYRLKVVKEVSNPSKEKEEDHVRHQSQ